MLCYVWLIIEKWKSTGTVSELYVFVQTFGGHCVPP